MSAMDPRIDDLIALAALGELDPDGRAELEAAAAADPEVAAEVSAALVAAAAIQSTVRHAPPPHLRAAILNRIDGVDQLPSTAVATPQTTTSTTPARRRAPAWRWPAAAAAAAALVVGAGALALSERDANDDDLAAAVIDADDAVSATMTGILDGRLVIHASAEEEAIVVEGDDLPAVSGSETYQLWRLDGEITSLGTFVPDATGHVEWRIDHAGALPGTLAVTLEPAGGSAAPTSPILATT